MKNASIIIKEKNALTILKKLKNKLNDSTADLSYNVFALKIIANHHADLSVQSEAKKLIESQITMQDELDYLNSCVIFLKNQLAKVPSYNTLTAVEISQQLVKLIKTVQDFEEVRNSLQHDCFQITSKLSQDGYGHLLMAA